MRDEHIKELLDRGGLAGLGERELAAMRSHAEACGECAHAVAAARVAAALFEARDAEGFEPSPFFHKRPNDHDSTPVRCRSRKAATRAAAKACAHSPHASA